MHQVVIDKPYEFVPPYTGRWWPRLIQRLLPWKLRREYGVQRVECQGLDLLRQSMDAGCGIVLAPNHCRPSDPMVVNLMCQQAGTIPFTMASWHVFKAGWLQAFVLRRAGGFSVYREGMDRQALHAAIDIIAGGTRPLVVFPEGVITRTNDRILAMMDGLSFIARSAAKKGSDQGKKVVVHPVAIRYQIHGEIEPSLHATLDDIERRLSWRPRKENNLVTRIYRVGEALLCLKELEYFGSPQSGDMPSRLQRLIDGILDPIEQEWVKGNAHHERTIVGRVKQLRTAIIRDMIDDHLDAQERSRRWDQLADMYLAQQLGHYPPDYVRSSPTRERMLETVEKFEEDLTDACRIHGPLTANVRVGAAIEVSPKRARGVAEDPVMSQLEQQLHDMLGIARSRENQDVVSSVG
jgi:1-acyl-sn-glycerol-3-phosphate acyltransferase